MSKALPRAISAAALSSLLVGSSFINAAPAQAIADGRNVISLPSLNTSSSLVRLQIGNVACTGTLITPTWVLTARHCIPEAGNAGAAIGSSTISTFEAVKQAIIHPTADLALVELYSPNNAATPEIYGAHVQPGEQGTASGWGGYSALNQQIAQQADVNVQRRITNLEGPDTSAILLEGQITNGRLMPGDSGGPLFINGQLAGVLSMSTAVEGAANHAGTVGWYVPVAEYADWITRYSGKAMPAITNAPSPLVDATAFPTYIPNPQIVNIPTTGSSTLDGFLRDWAAGSA
ncbi:S1 family peptidase [Corynebacterium callunae]|uniref:S1 family peptidase n=1 Tax=Corynebacterium callunae TaxID=1721 RepID=UPI0039820D73